MDRIELLPHAKVNLTLEVGATMADGYHEIDSVAQVIGLSDRLEIEKVSPGVIEVEADAPDVPSGPDNLVHHACVAFFASTGVDGGARCRLTKTIPAQAGLGGGSADAAAAVVGLDALYSTGLSGVDLAAIAARVGSDAAMFVYGGTVRMRGRGEQVQPLPDAPALDLVIIRPDTGVSTAWAYAELDRYIRANESQTGDAAESAIRTGDRSALIASLRNDFEPVVLEAFERIRRAREALLECGAEGTLLCGSGSAVFGAFAFSELAMAAAESVRGEFSSVFVTRTLTRAESEVVAI